jgi:MFS family permease
MRQRGINMNKQKPLIIGLVILFIITLLLIILNQSGLLLVITKKINYFYQKDSFVLFVITSNTLIMLIFSILGYRLADKKGRDPIKWVILCCLFNVWAYLALYYLKPLSIDKTINR